VIAKERVRLTESDPRAVLAVVAGTVRAVIRRAPESPYGVVGVGIGVPGIVDDRGTVLKAPNFGWTDVPLQPMLQEELALNIRIDNEANCGAVGEKQYGIGSEAGDLVYISAGVGIGADIILGHELYRGSTGFSGELGHMKIQADHGLPCSCGST